MKEKLFIISLLLCVFTLNAVSQKTVTIKSFAQTSDHIPGSDRRNDLNGVPCALIKVYVVDDIDRVEGNKIGDIIKRGNVEKWVYMCKGSRNIRLHLNKHLPVKVVFQDYQISGLESNRVYELVIETPDISLTTDSDNSPFQKLTINYSPAHAVVLIDSKIYKGNGRIEAFLPVGEHSYTIACENYVSVDGSVRITSKAPREITENLVVENSDNSITYSNLSNDNAVGQTNPKNTTANIANSSQPSKSINDKKFNFIYNDAKLKCKAKNGIVTITQISTKSSKLIIPATVSFEGSTYLVKSIKSSFSTNNSVTHLEIEDGIETIEDVSFYNFYKLVDVTFPASIKHIDSNAFNDNKKTIRYHAPFGIDLEKFGL